MVLASALLTLSKYWHLQRWLTCGPSERSRVPLVVKRKNQAHGGSGRRFYGAALPTPCRPTTSHHILDGQQ